MVARHRRGISSLGCLVTLLIVVAIGYFAVNIGGVYFRRYSFQDAMKQEARFAAHKTDEEILARLRAKADSLGLPPGARRVHVRRKGGVVFIWADYFETLELPGMTRDVELTAHAERAF